METKEFRKELKIWLSGLTKLQTELERLNTPENQKTMLEYPAEDGLWRHPQAHLFERLAYFIECSRKTTSKMVEALPKQRNPKKVIFKDENNDSKKTKGKKVRKADPGSGEGAGDTKRQDGSTGNALESSGRKPRKPRSDKGKSRKS